MLSGQEFGGGTAEREGSAHDGTGGRPDEDVGVAEANACLFEAGDEAAAASIADRAICSGVTGTCGLRPTVSPAPVIAHVMKTFQFTACP